jgi:hypothetical protein
MSTGALLPLSVLAGARQPRLGFAIDRNDDIFSLAGDLD